MHPISPQPRAGVPPRVAPTGATPTRRHPGRTPAIITPMGGNLKKPLTLAVCLLLGLGLLEGGAYLVYSGYAREHERRIIDEMAHPGNDLVVQNCVPHPYALYMPKPNLVAHGVKQHNSRGFRGREIDLGSDALRIVCLGGSTTYGWTVKDPECAYPRQLEKQLLAAGLHVEVINAGLPMGTSAEILATLHFRVLPLAPRLVILHTGLNDVFPILMPGYQPDYTHDRHPLAIPNRGFFREYRGLLRSNVVRLLALGVLRTKGFIEGQASYVYPEHWNTRHWKTGDAEDSRRYIGFRNNLRSLLAICERNDIQVIVSPDNVLDMPEYPALMAAYRKNIEIMRELGGEFSNAVFFDSRTIEIPRECFDDPCHLNRRGEELKARAFAEFIFRGGILAGRSLAPRRTPSSATEGMAYDS